MQLTNQNAPTRRRVALMGSALLLIPFLAMAGQSSRAAESAVVIPPPAADAAAPSGDGMQTAVLAGGCFWGVQAVFQHTKGVTQAVSGYAGGEQKTAHYEMVGSGRPAMPNPCRSRSIRSRFPTARCCGSISRWRTTRPSSTVRVRTPARNTAPPSSMPTTTRSASPRPISRSSIRPTPSAARS